MLTDTWHTSKRSGGNGCVKVKHDVAVRVCDSKDQRPDAPILQFTPRRWAEFVAAVTAGELGRSELA